MLLNLWQTITAHLWSFLGVLAGGIAIGYGQRGFGVQRRMQEQAQFFQGKVHAAIRESDERKLRVKTVEARLATLEPLEGQLRERDRIVLELTAAAEAESARHAAQVDEQAAAIRQLLAAPPKVVEKIVEAVVEKPVTVEKVVEKIVREVDDTQVRQLGARVAELDAQVQRQQETLRERDAALARLNHELVSLKSAPPKAVEKIVAQPVTVERLLEKIVEIDRPVIVDKVVEKPVTVERVVEAIVEVDRPVIVEKRVEIEKPVVIERVVEVERLVRIPVPMPAPAPVAPAAAKPAARPRRRGVARPQPQRPAPRPRRKASDDLELIRGVGPKLAKFLRGRGITLFRQIARWQAADIERFEAELPQFKGRIRREGWVRSAATEHRRKYGREP